MADKVTQHVSQQRVIDAPADKIFAVLSDIRNHAAIDGGGAVQGRPDGPIPLEPGATFTMGMRMHGTPYRTTNEVIEWEPDRRLAWRTISRIAGREVFGGAIWRWELEPREDGTTLVRETYDWSRLHHKALFLGLLHLDRLTPPAMDRSLRCLATLVEPNN